MPYIAFHTEVKKPLEKEPRGLQITKELEDVEVDEGEPATLEMCFVSDTPATVAWFKEMRPVEEGRRIKIITDENSSKLVIKKTVGKDEGLYKCSVQSGEQELNSSAELIVEGIWKFVIFLFECSILLPNERCHCFHPEILY